MKLALILLMLWSASAPPAYGQDRGNTHRDSSVPGRSRIYKREELTWPQIEALDRERTLFILPVGMIEEHGPHLPVGANTLGVMFEADWVSRRVSRALPEWKLVMMPPINYGEGGANEIATVLVHPGTYGVRQSTLRSLVADLGGQIVQNGFKWIFVMNGHGAPTHNIAINEACDFISETYGVTMLHLTSLFRADAAIQSQGRRVNASISRQQNFRPSAWMFTPESARRRHACGSAGSRSSELQKPSEPSGTHSGAVTRNTVRREKALVHSARKDPPETDERPSDSRSRGRSR
jgi:hypothetical protein